MALFLEDYMKRYYLKDQVWKVGENCLKLKYVECEEASFDPSKMVKTAFELLPVGHPKKPIVKKTKTVSKAKK